MLQLVEDVPKMVGMVITVMMQMFRTDPIGSMCIDGFPESSYVTYLLDTRAFWRLLAPPPLRPRRASMIETLPNFRIRWRVSI